MSDDSENLKPFLIALSEEFVEAGHQGDMNRMQSVCLRAIQLHQDELSSVDLTKDSAADVLVAVDRSFQIEHRARVLWEEEEHADRVRSSIPTFPNYSQG